MFFKRKYSVTFINGLGNVIYSTMNISVIPRIDEQVFLEKEKKYFRVSNITHYLNDKHGIFIFLTPIN